MASSAVILLLALLSRNPRGADAQGFEYGDPIDVRVIGDGWVGGVVFAGGVLLLLLLLLLERNYCLPLDGCVCFHVVVFLCALLKRSFLSCAVGEYPQCSHFIAAHVAKNVEEQANGTNHARTPPSFPVPTPLTILLCFLSPYRPGVRNNNNHRLS